MMSRFLESICALALLTGAASAQNAPSPTFKAVTLPGGTIVGVTGTSPVPTADPNNAAYSSAGATFATGATVTAGRAIYLNCSASGSVTMSLQAGGSLAYPVTAGANVLPFAVTSVSADTASCTHQNIN